LFNRVTEARLKPWQRTRMTFWKWRLRFRAVHQAAQLSHATLRIELQTMNLHTAEVQSASVTPVALLNM
jgi:hypothetical protein